MVRSSDIVKKSRTEPDPQKADPSSAFLRLGEIMQIRTSGATEAKPPRPAVPETRVSPPPPEPSETPRENKDTGTPAIEAGRADSPAVAIPDPASDEAMEVYALAKQTMRDVRTAVSSDEFPDITPAFALVHRIVSGSELILNTHPPAIRDENDYDYYITQPIHTMFYALKIGLRMPYATQQLTELAMCCLMQNIGMFLIPEDLINKKGALTAEEFSMIRKHPEMGRELLRPYQEDHPWLLKTVYQHHERENGQGYPLGVQGDEITDYAKIIGLCDSYEAMTHSRPHRKAVMQYDSVKQLIESRERQFSPQILKLFLQELTIYPIGSYVKLNNAAIGRVVATNKFQPMRPVINLLIDGKGDRVAVAETIDLARNNVLTILDVVPEEEIPR
jgi:HD-GYP domain-containing protein (c-di-GMP phosphodiesterase class II)